MVATVASGNQMASDGPNTCNNDAMGNRIKATYTGGTSTYS